MSNLSPPDNNRARSAVRKLLECIDRALLAVRDVEHARTALAKEAARLSQLRVIPREQEDSHDK
jgi:hypothetical protein